MKKSNGGKSTKTKNNFQFPVFGVLSVVALLSRGLLLDNFEANMFISAAIIIFLMLSLIPSLNGKSKAASYSSLISAFSLGLSLIFTIGSSEALYGVMGIIGCVLCARLVNYVLGRDFDRKDSLCFGLISGLLSAVYFIGMKASLGNSEDWFSFLFAIVSIMVVSFLATLPGLNTKSE